MLNEFLWLWVLSGELFSKYAIDRRNEGQKTNIRLPSLAHIEINLIMNVIEIVRIEKEIWNQ